MIRNRKLYTISESVFARSFGFDGDVIIIAIIRPMHTRTIYGLPWIQSVDITKHRSFRSFSLSLAHIFTEYIVILLPFYCCHFIFVVDFFCARFIFNNNLRVCVCVRHGNEFHLFFIVNAGILKCIIKNNVICSKLKYSMVAFLWSLWSFDGGMSDSSFFSLKAMKKRKICILSSTSPGVKCKHDTKDAIFSTFLLVYWAANRFFLLPEMVFNRSRSAVRSEVIKKQCQRVQK